MANNIKITGNIINTTTVTRYSSDDTNLISSQNLQENFGGAGDYIEYYIYAAGGNLLNTNYNYLDYKLPTTTGLTPSVSNNPNTTGNIQTTDIGITSTLVTPTSSLYPTIEIDPVKDIQNIGYTSGEFNSRYNFFRNILSNNIDRALFVKEISQDRTEIRLASTTLTNDEIESTVNNVINQINSSSYYVDYLLNFGDNQQYVAVNIALNKATTGYEVLFKMYEPLPPEVQEKQTLWVVEEKVFPYIFDINLDTLIIPPPPPTLRGPNFNIPIPTQTTVSTTYTNYDTALMTLQSLQNSSYQQLLNLMTTQSISINVDYTDFNNFVFFGSAYQRVANFYTKVQQIEDYTNLINLYTPYVATTASLQTEINQYSSSINTLITQFDGYETYLYFESSSYAWPKSGSYKPYSLLSTGSAAVISWFNTLTESALNYDNENYDNLVFAVPNFIRDDENNNQFLTFLNMVGQYFDNIWIYLKAVTDVNLANNNLNAGISKDLVYNQLQSLGIKLYNSQAGESVDQFLIGANTGSSVFDNNFSITGSYLNNIPRKDLLAELYKRIYHNLPLLLKTKGTKTGLEYLITTFGIPSRTYITGSSISSSILDVKEYGGSLKSNLIKGYNNEKVRIVNNSIASGSVLSSMLSLQTFPTASNEFRENDSHFIDISFSPESQINTYISGAIASNNPTWSLDDYIGDPRQLYNNSYPDLNEQRTLYFETGVPGFSGFTGSYMDYNGFIRLIQFFDNALFKMLGDFIPERTSLSTGVTIESPVLERNKVVYPIPDPIEQEVYEAEYPAPIISSPYDTLYNDLGGDKAAYFDGEISGSEINVYNYFEETNYNPYLEGHPNTNWILYNVKHPINERINLGTFLHSDYNVLFNNVSENVTSQFRKKIEYIWGTTNNITSSVELQDSYLTLRSYNISRYEGSKLTSKFYNAYTSASYTGSSGITTQSGDISYGKTAVIDRNSYKLGWIQTIPSQSLNFNDKTVINLKYLIDTKNEVTDLNSYNNNWCDIQNIFKSGKPAILSITDKNQNRREGQKLVWKGGYRFDPIIYRENKEVLNFIFDNFQYTKTKPLGFLSSDLRKYIYETNNAGNVDQTPNNNIANQANINFFYINGIASPSTATGNNQVAPEAINYTDWKYNTSLAANKRLNYLNISNANGVDPSYKAPTYRFDLFKFDNYTTANAGANSTDLSPKAFNTEPVSSNVNNNIYKITRSGNYRIYGGAKVTVTILGDNSRGDQAGYWRIFKLALLTERATSDNYIEGKWREYDTPLAIANQSIISGIDPYPGNNYYNPTDGSIKLYSESPTAQSAYTFNFTFNKTFNTDVSTDPRVGDYLRLSFYFIDVQGVYRYYQNVNIKFEDVYWGIVDTEQVVTEYFYDSQYTLNNDIFYNLTSTNKTNDTLNINQLFSGKYFYSALFSGSSTNYSEIIDKISIEKGDLIKFGRFQDPGSYYEVINVQKNNFDAYKIVLNDTVLPAPKTNLSGSLSYNFAILRPKPDETSIILEGKNAVGRQNVQTALLVPYDASTTLTDNVGTIIKSLNNYI